VTPRKNLGGRPRRPFAAARTVVYLPTAMKRQLERLAQGSSVTALVIDAVRAYLARRRIPTR
jgi:hypothetical protein